MFSGILFSLKKKERLTWDKMDESRRLYIKSHKLGEERK